MTKNRKTSKLSFVLIAAVFTVLCLMSTMLTACGSTSLSLDKTSETMFVGDTVKITATISGNDSGEIEWTTSNAEVATVRRGTVTAKGKGTAVITATIEDTNVSATCNITVNERTVEISKTTATINLDESNTLQLTATASDNGEITWTSGNPTVATVDNKGLVTGLDIGEAVITAQRGTATATCTVTVTEPSRPADYYKMTKQANADCVAVPGVWHWHADGSMGGDFGFESEPLHRDSTVSATLNPIPNVANSQYFYFRYQPDEVELDRYYTMTLKITVSEACTLRLGSYRADKTNFAAKELTVKANEETDAEYIGYRNDKEPFSIRINTPITAEKITITAKLVSVVANDGTDLPEYHTTVIEKPVINYEEIEKNTGEYEVVAKTNAEVVAAPGIWAYNKSSGTTVDTATYNNGTITFNMSSIDNQPQQLRYKPDVEVGTKIKLTFDIVANAALKVACSTNGSAWYTQNIVADTSVSFNCELTIVNAANPVYIQITHATGTSDPVNVTVSNVKIYKEVAGGTPAGETYDLEVRSSQQVIDNPGTWGYNKDGASVVAGTPNYNDGTITLNFSSVEPAQMITLRYKPDVADGTKFTVSFTATASKPIEVACFMQNVSEGWKTGNISADNGSVNLNGAYTTGENTFLVIRFKNAFTENTPLNITVSNIEIVAEDETPAGETYTLQLRGKADVIANPGIWAYNRDGASTVEGTPTYNDGTITINFSSVVPTGTSDTAPADKKFITLRLRPDLTAGTQYTISFTVTTSQPVDVACFLTVANTGYQKANVTEANGSVTITGTYTAVDDDFITVRIGNAFTEATPLNITVSNIVITPAA